MKKASPNFIRFTFSLTVVFILAGAAPCRADHNSWAHTLYFENDLFNGTDNNYTNGVKYSIISPDFSPHAEKSSLPRNVLEYIYKIPFIKESGLNYHHKAEFSFGQNMYTPADTSRYDLIVNDRPYAGWTYISLGYHRRVEEQQKAHFLDTVEVQIGIVGPLSFSEQTQKMVHELRRLQIPNGWDNQLDNEPGLNIAYERKWLFHNSQPQSFSMDLIPHLGATVGNVFTYLNGGMELRLGWNMPPNFGVSLIRPAGSTRLVADQELCVYIFGGLNSRLVLRDIFLDGNTFAHSHSVERKDAVTDFAAGITFGWRNFMLTLTEVHRTKEFVGQQDEHSFGSISLSFFWH